MDNSIYRVCEICGEKKHISQIIEEEDLTVCKECDYETRIAVEASRVADFIAKKQIKWEQRRYEIAKECVAVLMSSEITLEDAAKISVEQADALIAELKKGGMK